MTSVEDDYKDSASQLPKCCCCHVWHDTFERDEINVLPFEWGDVAVKRYAFGPIPDEAYIELPGGSYLLYPGLFPYDDYTPAAWSIVGGALSCSTSREGVRLGPTDVALSDGMSVCFDMTFTGSGKVYYGASFVFEYDTGRFRFRTQNANLDGIWFSHAWSSGTTYRIRVNQTTYGGTEVWVDDEQFWAAGGAGSVAADMGSWFFDGSGTLTIDNIDVYMLGQFDPVFAQSNGFPMCYSVDHCNFPWIDSGTGEPPEQIQVTYSATIGGCSPCTSFFLPPGSPGTGGTYILDKVDCYDFSGCVCYELAGSFGCYDLMSVALSYPSMTIQFCETQPTTTGVGLTGHCLGGGSPPLFSWGITGYDEVIGVPGIRQIYHGDFTTWSWTANPGVCGISSVTVSTVEEG